MTDAITPIDPGGWASYLDPDEQLLWEGAPNPGVRFRAADLPIMIFGAFFGGFALFWIIMASWITGETGFVGYIFPLFGLPFLAVGIYLVVGRFFMDAYMRKRTRYALTTKRGIIATQAFARSLKSYPIDADTEVDYQPGEEASIFFATEFRRGSKGRTYSVRHGFEYIPGGDQVYRMIRAIQQDRIGDTE